METLYSTRPFNHQGQRPDSLSLRAGRAGDRFYLDTAHETVKDLMSGKNPYLTKTCPEGEQAPPVVVNASKPIGQMSKAELTATAEAAGVTVKAAMTKEEIQEAIEGDPSEDDSSK